MSRNNLVVNAHWAEGKKRYVPICPVCHSHGHEIVDYGMHEGGYWFVRECRACKVQYYYEVDFSFNNPEGFVPNNDGITSRSGEVMIVRDGKLVFADRRKKADREALAVKKPKPIPKVVEESKPAPPKKKKETSEYTHCPVCGKEARTRARVYIAENGMCRDCRTGKTRRASMV